MTIQKITLPKSIILIAIYQFGYSGKMTNIVRMMDTTDSHIHDIRKMLKKNKIMEMNKKGRKYEIRIIDKEVGEACLTLVKRFNPEIIKELKKDQ